MASAVLPTPAIPAIAEMTRVRGRCALACSSIPVSPASSAARPTNRGTGPGSSRGTTGPARPSRPDRATAGRA